MPVIPVKPVPAKAGNGNPENAAVVLGSWIPHQVRNDISALPVVAKLALPPLSRGQAWPSKLGNYISLRVASNEIRFFHAPVYGRRATTLALLIATDNCL
jgi:hypothetical protein